jgi:MFS family permease
MSSPIRSGRSGPPRLAEALAVGRTTWLLTVCQTLYFATVSIDLTLTGVVGLHMAPSLALATLPLAMITIVGTAGAVLAGLLTHRLGYPTVMVLGAVAAIGGGALSTFAVTVDSFPLLCAGTGLVGLYRATGGYIRFMAADLAPAGKRERALSFILFGGLIAAFAGPFLATASVDLLPAAYAGPYLAVTVLAAATIPPILIVGRRKLPVGEQQEAQPPVPLRTVARSGDFLTALLVLTIAGAGMTMTMAVGPIGSESAGHSMHQGASIIQWHLVAMFAPSIFSGALMERIGRRGTALAGCVLLISGALAGATGTAYLNFLLALALNGVGWNLLFVSGSAYLIRCYPPGRGGRIQAVVEGVSSAATVLASLFASTIYQAFGWRGSNVPLLVLGPLLIVLVSLAGRPGSPAAAPEPGLEPTPTAGALGEDQAEPLVESAPDRT